MGTLIAAGHRFARVCGGADHLGDGRVPSPGLTVDQAAARLGVSVTTVRRRIRQNTLRATLVDGDRGATYRVHLDGGRGTAAAGGTDRHRGRSDRPRPLGDGGSVAALLALVDRLRMEIRRLHGERAELLGRLGVLQAQLDHARATIRAPDGAPQPKPSPGPVGVAAESEPPRPTKWTPW